jgi:hypothetical protein
MLRTAGCPFQLVVGDGGSTDGTLDMLRSFERAGRLTVELAPGGRSHTDWLDKWIAECPTHYAVFSDSDVEFRRAGWLAAMVVAAHRERAALVATRIQARGGVDYRHPKTGAARVLAERPEPWLMLLDVQQIRGVVTTSFRYRDEPKADGTGKVGFDTAAAFFRDLKAAGLSYVELPREFQRSYRHYGSMSWKRLQDAEMPPRERARQLAKLVRISANLQRARVQDRFVG